MDIIQAFTKNPEFIPVNLSQEISIARDLNKQVSLSTNENGVEFQIKFSWENNDLIQDILISPIGTVSHRMLSLLFDDEYYAYWERYSHFAFEVRSVSISNFRHPKILHSINIESRKKIDELSIFNAEVQGKLIIKDFNRVSVKETKAQEMSISLVKELVLTKVSGTKEVRVMNCDRLSLTHSHCKSLLKMVGLFDTINLAHSSFPKTCLVETSFNLLNFVDFDMHDLEIDLPNPEGKLGDLVFSDSYLTDKLSINSALVGNSFIWKNATKEISHFKLHPIYLTFQDNKFNPREVELNDVEWRYNGIVTNSKYAEGKRRFINQLKNFYVAKDDILNSQLQYAFEKKWYLENHKGNIPLLLSRWSNNFGLSLGLPLLWILLVCLLESALILRLSHNCYPVLVDNWGVFFHLMNPTHKTSIFIDVLGTCEYPKYYSNLLPLIDNIGRILIGYLIFQFANAFRYKFKLR